MKTLRPTTESGAHIQPTSGLSGYEKFPISNSSGGTITDTITVSIDYLLNGVNISGKGIVYYDNDGDIVEIWGDSDLSNSLATGFGGGFSGGIDGVNPTTPIPMDACADRIENWVNACIATHPHVDDQFDCRLTGAMLAVKQGVNELLCWLASWYEPCDPGCVV